MKKLPILLLLAILAGCIGEEITLNTPAASNPPSSSNTAGQGSFEIAKSFSCNNILVDASHDGGVWWYPQVGSFNSTSEHQGQKLADYWRGKGYRVDELPRGMVVTQEILQHYGIVVRAGVYGNYQQGEITAYQTTLDKGITLLLLADHSAADQLSEHLGIVFSGKTSATGVVSKFQNHSIVANVNSIPYIAGSLITNAANNSNIVPLGWVSAESELPVMAVVKHPRSSIFALGDVNGLECLPQPMTDNLLSWMQASCSKF